MTAGPAASPLSPSWSRRSFSLSPIAPTPAWRLTSPLLLKSTFQTSQLLLILLPRRLPLWRCRPRTIFKGRAGEGLGLRYRAVATAASKIGRAVRCEMGRRCYGTAASLATPLQFFVGWDVQEVRLRFAWRGSDGSHVWGEKLIWEVRGRRSWGGD